MFEVKPAECVPETVSPLCFPSQNFGLTGLGEALSDKVVINKKQPQAQRGESCQKLLDELSVMEHLLTEEISVLNRMKKIESDCLSRRVRRMAPTDILASFPEMRKKK